MGDRRECRSIANPVPLVFKVESCMGMEMGTTGKPE